VRALGDDEKKEKYNAPATPTQPIAGEVSFYSLKLIEQELENMLDKLEPRKRELFVVVLSHMIYKLSQQIINYTYYVARKLIDRGVMVDVSQRFEKTPRGAIIVISLELKDINPKLLVLHRRFLTKYSTVDKWTKWAFVKTLAKIAEELIDKSTQEASIGDDQEDIAEEIAIAPPAPSGQEPGGGGGAQKRARREKQPLPQ